MNLRNQLANSSVNSKKSAATSMRSKSNRSGNQILFVDSRESRSNTQNRLKNERLTMAKLKMENYISKLQDSVMRGEIISDT